MLEIARTHARFDLALELLTVLRVEPYPTPLRDIAADLGLGHQSDVRQLIRDLNRKGVDVRTWNDNGAVCGIHPDSRKRAERAASDYYDTVYGTRKLSFLN